MRLQPQAVPPLRQRDKLVPLIVVTGTPPADGVSRCIFEDLEVEGPGNRGRITTYCLAESFDRSSLESLLRVRFKGVNTTSDSQVDLYPEVVHMSTVTGPEGQRGDAFFFDVSPSPPSSPALAPNRACITCPHAAAVGTLALSRMWLSLRPGGAAGAAFAIHWTCEGRVTATAGGGVMEWL